MFQLLLLVGPACALPAAWELPPEERGEQNVEATQDELVLEPIPSPAGPASANPTLTRGADGEIYLAWFEQRGARGGAIRISVLEQDGWTEPLEVAQGKHLRRSWADSPSVSALESGALLATWLTNGAGRHGLTTKFSVSADRGRHWTAPRPLHSDLSPAEHGFASVVPIDAEHFGAIWLDGRDTLRKDRGRGATGLYFRTITAAGELGPETLLDDRVCDCCQTSLTSTSAGSLLAVYRDRSSEELRDISAVRFDGETWSRPAAVHGDGWLIAGCPVNGPRVASERGTTVTAWFTGVGEGGGSVRVAFQGTSHDRFGFPIDVDDGQPVGRVDVVSAGDGSAIVSWLEYTEQAAEWRVRQVWKDGRVGRSITIEQVPFDRDSGYLRMVATDTGTVIAWTMAGPERSVGTARIRARK